MKIANILLTFGQIVAYIPVGVLARQINYEKPSLKRSSKITYARLEPCPLPCKDYSNINSWTTSFSIESLERCKKPMLVQLSSIRLFEESTNDVVLRTCTIPSSQDRSAHPTPSDTEVENPKQDLSLFDPILKSAPACTVADTSKATTKQLKVSVAENSGQSGSQERTDILLNGLKAFFAVDKNCNENFIFGYYNGTAASAYTGKNLGKSTMSSVLTTMEEKVQTLTSDYTTVQLCSTEGQAERTLGVFVGSSTDLKVAIASAKSWSDGKCVEEKKVKASNIQFKVNVVDIPSSDSDSFATQAVDPPKQNANGTCATHLIVLGDTCYALSQQYGISVANIESFNKGKTWAWTTCSGMMAGYNMCLSSGAPPLPPAQEGLECGPMKPGTPPPSDSSISLASLNPCPLNACCSNWGYCGIFAQHCEVHAPEGGAPGSTLPGYQNTCISNCGTQIVQNGGAPTSFSRIGYYESWNMDRSCLRLGAKNANTDGSYTHIHWAFAEIDPQTWKPIIKDPYKQWADFKALKGVKRVVSIGGLTYSTSPDTYNILREAIITNRELFSTNVAQFLNDEGLDGVDMDWEYPGATDILVNGSPIGKPSDGLDYAKFLTVLKRKVATGKTVSIAAPASYWYLKAFNIKLTIPSIDYIVYMTYDLHGQWDYGNDDAFDSCPSGMCIRSHVNITETRSALALLTKSGMPNSKIFVGEASYGRALHMAQDGCYGPTCLFTGTRDTSDATPGRCTKVAGYIANAEILEIVGRGEGKSFRDNASDTDVLLYKGDYIGYMSSSVKDKRRAEWKKLNFGGSVDWAVDLQRFGAEG